MNSKKLEKEFDLILQSLEKTHEKIINSINNLDEYLCKQYSITQEDKLFIEDFLITLDIIRIKTKDSIFMLKKNKLEKFEKVVYFNSKEIKDIYVNSYDIIEDIFKKDS